MSSGDAIEPESELPLSVSKRLLRSLSQRLKRKNDKSEGSFEDEDGGDLTVTGVSFRRLTLYARGGGSCKVSADTGDEFGDAGSGRRQSNSSEEEGERYAATIRRNKEATMNCFSYGLKEVFWRRNGRSQRLLEQKYSRANVNVHLPDDILELCLVRLPPTSLMNARLVCRKWRSLTMAPRFLQMRRDQSFQTPWLFLFGILKAGSSSGQVHAFDVSQNQWHQIDSKALRGRFLFSVACIQDEVYIVGGYSSSTNLERADRTHKGVSVFDPSSKTIRKVASMNYARSLPLLGVLEHIPYSLIVRNQQNQSESCSYRSRVSGVYQDPHRLATRRQSRHLPMKMIATHAPMPSHTNTRDRITEVHTVNVAV